MSNSPFEAHDRNEALWDATMAETVNGKPGASVVFGGKTYPASVGPFFIKQIFQGGGFSPRLTGQAIVRKANLPALPAKFVGQQMLVNQPGGSSRTCQISDVEDTYTEWRINLWDVSQGA